MAIFKGPSWPYILIIATTSIFTFLYFRPPIPHLPSLPTPALPSCSWRNDSIDASQEHRHRLDHLSFDTGTSKPPGHNYTRTLVIARLNESDVSWISKHLPDLPTAIYTVDSPSPKYRVPQNKGHEGMVYLTYIIDNYNDLADTTLFMHSHQYAWHNNIVFDNDNVEGIRRLSDDRVARMGYVNARCDLNPGCPDYIHLDRPEVDLSGNKGEERFFTPKLWKELFPFERVPTVLSQPCCAQFVVSRDRIRLNSRGQYQRIRQWLMKTKLDDGDSGRVLEYVWQYLFTRQGQVCPRMDTCYCDGYGVCFGGAEKLKSWLDKKGSSERADEWVRKWKDAGGNGTLVEGYNQGDKDEKFWNEEADKLRKELENEKREAIERGKSVKNREAEASSQAWREQ